MSRTELTSNATFHINPAGNDTIGDGSIGNPWKTRGASYNRVQRDYDLKGFSVVFQLADGVHVDGFNPSGPMVGARGPLSILYRGNTANPRACTLRPAGGYSFGPAFGALMAIEGFHMDHVAANADMISAAQGGELWIRGPVVFGRSSGIGYNDISAAFGGRVFFSASAPYQYEIDSTGDALAGRTASFAVGNSAVTVNDPTGIKFGMAARATGLQRCSWVAAISGNVITLNGGSDAIVSTQSNTPITFTMARQNHIDVGAGGAVVYNTDSNPNLISCLLSGKPFFYSGFLLANGPGSTISIQSIGWSGAAEGSKFVVRQNATVDTQAMTNLPQSYLPGDVFSATVSFAAGATTVTLPSNPSLPHYGTQFKKGDLIVGPGIRASSDPQYMSAADGTYVTNISPDNLTITLSRPTASAQTGVTIYSCGTVGQGGQYV